MRILIDAADFLRSLPLEIAHDILQRLQYNGISRITFGSMLQMHIRGEGLHVETLPMLSEYGGFERRTLQRTADGLSQ